MDEGSVGADGCGGDRRASLHVLLAEDNPVNQRVTQLLLGRLGHLVDTVGDGVEAVAAVTRTSYDVVLMDVQMPRLDGLEATRRIRAGCSRHQPPVVALTGGDLAGDRAACRAAGMDAFVTKPLTIVALAAVLAEVTDGRVARSDRDVDGGPPVGRAPSSHPGPDAATSREELITRRLDELAGPVPLDEDVDLFAGIVRSFIDRSPSLVDDLAEAVHHRSVTAVEHQAHRLKGSAANLGGAALAALLERIERRCRSGQPCSLGDLQPVRAELAELRRSLATVADALESRPGVGQRSTGWTSGVPSTG
jgi:CheY-like chemotaxis protein